MRILLVISEVPPVKSGVARVADNLSRGLIARGHQVDILSLQDIPRYELGEFRLSSMPLKLPSLKERVRSHDLIHLHGPVPTFSDVFLIWTAKGLGWNRPRVVYTYHAPVDLRGFPMRLLVWSFNELQERLARLADHVVVTTHAYAQRLARHVPTEKLSVIPWGVHYERFFAPVEKPHPFTVVYLGQIRPYKGLPVLLKAATGLQDARLWVIGDGHHSETCRRMADQMGLRDVTFWGSLPDEEMISLLKQGHAIVLPSVTRSEAFGIALLEGMAAGNVPVASHLPGVSELVGNEGLAFRAGDAEALRKVLIRIRDDAGLRSHLASLAQAKARRYSWDRTILEYEHVFGRLVGQPLPISTFVPGEAKIR